MLIIPGVLASSLKAGGDYESIATVTGNGSATTLSFTSISSAYKHLQIRGIFRNGTGLDVVDIRFNSDSGNNYAYHRLYGTGSTAGAEASQPNNKIFFGFSPSNTSIFSASVMDILDYGNTNKNKTTRVLAGYDTNGGGEISLDSGLWINTNAITQIDIVARNYAFATNSHFALYGIKG